MDMGGGASMMETEGSAVSSSPPDPPEGAESTAEAGGYELDCYPYTFSPLLLFAQQRYFDKGYSNYNSVAQFFSPALDVNMLENVLYDRKNMLYEELLELVLSKGMLVQCCIDAHCTAFQVLPDQSVIYYDPLSPSLSHLSGDSCKQFVLFMLLKCKYADSNHVQENKNHYTGDKSTPIRRTIYKLWKTINKATIRTLGVRMGTVSLNLDRYLLINSPSNPQMMSTQQTGNTCYFQSYLFAVLCKVQPPLIHVLSLNHPPTITSHSYHPTPSPTPLTPPPTPLPTTTGLCPLAGQKRPCD
jgi:hypothetical protein